MLIFKLWYKLQVDTLLSTTSCSDNSATASSESDTSPRTQTRTSSVASRSSRTWTNLLKRPSKPRSWLANQVWLTRILFVCLVRAAVKSAKTARQAPKTPSTLSLSSAPTERPSTSSRTQVVSRTTTPERSSLNSVQLSNSFTTRESRTEI